MQSAIEYLKYLHGLEIVAGMNFKAAKEDLQARGRLPLKLYRDLTLAQQQEMRHARLVRDMLATLGYHKVRELMMIPGAILDDLERAVPAPWPPEMGPWARICYNHAFEERFAGGGAYALMLLMQEFAWKLPPGPQEELRFQSWCFYCEVEADEIWHVELDKQLMAIYRGIHADFDMDALIGAAQVGRSPSIRSIIRAKQAFVRRATA